MAKNNVNEENVKNYCKRHGLNGGIFENMAITFANIQNSLEKILSANKKNKKLIQRLSEDKFIEKSETSDKNLALSSHYFSNFFAGMSLFEEDFNDAINDQENEDFKIVIGLFKTYPKYSNKEAKDAISELGTEGYIAFNTIKPVGKQIKSLISDISKIESAKNKTTDKDIISVFQQFQQINNTISNNDNSSNYLFAHKDSLLKLIDEYKYWETGENQEIKDENNKYKKTSESYETHENSETDANSNLPSRKTTISSNLSQEITSLSTNSIYDINTKSDGNEYITSLTYIIKNNAPDMIKDIKSIEEQIDKNKKLKEVIDFYEQNIDKRKQYTLLNPLHWSLIRNLREARKRITANILGVCTNILNGKNGETEGTKINNLNKKLVDIYKRNFETNSKTKSLDNKERKDEIIFKSGSCVVDNSSESQKHDEKQHGN